MWKKLVLIIALSISWHSARAGNAVVTDGRFTNVYVYPHSDTQNWDQYIAGLRPDAQQFSRAAIDGFTDSIMSGSWPSYFDSLVQYSGINPPRFFGSAVASKSCVDAAMNDLHNGVLQWDTIRSLANCHADGMDPSPQLNLIFSPDIRIADIPNPPIGTGQEMCTSATSVVAWHAWGVNTPNFAALPTNPRCANSFAAFTATLMSHEIVEMISDPAGVGMGTWGIHELGDNCEGQNSIVNGFSVTRYWSNSDNSCQPTLDPPAGAEAQTWVLGKGSPLIRFTGDVHELSLNVPSDRVTTDATATQVMLVVQTGGDDLRGGSSPGDNADVTLEFASGSVTKTNINQGNSWGNGETHAVLLNLPAVPLRVSDITGVVITTRFGGGLSGDNWNVDKVALVVSFPSGSRLKGLPLTTVHNWLDASAAPLVRFTGDVHDHSELLVTPQDVGVLAQALNLVISTGNDDLRGGSNAGDNCDVILELNSGNSITLANVNGGQTWGGWTINTIAVPQPLRGGDIKAVRLHTNFGGGISGDNWNVNRIQLQATVSSLPFVRSISPPKGPATGGTKMILTGGNFTGVTEVDFGLNRATFTVDSPTQITAFSPSLVGTDWALYPNGAPVVHVGVTAPQGSSALSDVDRFSYVPVVTSVSPSEGPTSGGTPVSIDGLGFNASSADASRISFGGIAAQRVYCTDGTHCIVGSPPSSPQQVDITVNGSLPTPADHFTYLGPTITSISPNIGPETGNIGVFISGVSLASSGGAEVGSVRFGPTLSPDAVCIGSSSTSQCTATLPPGRGIVDIIVTVNGVSSNPTPADQFIYAPFPAINALSPSTGPASGGTVVTVTGVNFATLPGTTKFKFGSTAAANATCSSSHTCVVTSPPWNPLVDLDNVVGVTASVGNFTSVGSGFTYPPPPDPPGPPCDLPHCRPRPPPPGCTGSGCR